MHIALVIFDMAGTTVADNGGVAKAFQQAMAHSGYSIPEEKINPIMGYKKPEAINMLLQQFEPDKNKISGAYIEIIHNRFIENMLEHYQHGEGVMPIKGVEEVFKILQQRGIKIGLNTGFSKIIADTILNRLQWKQKGLVDFMIASDEVPAGRPHPFMIQELMKLAGVSDPGNVIKVGDTEVDVNEGKNAGCLYSIAVTTGAFTKQELEPYQPSYIINDLHDIFEIIDNQQ